MLAVWGDALLPNVRLTSRNETRLFKNRMDEMKVLKVEPDAFLFNISI